MRKTEVTPVVRCRIYSNMPLYDHNYTDIQLKLVTEKSLESCPWIRRVCKSKIWIFEPFYILVATSHNLSVNGSEFSCCWSVAESSKITSSKVKHFLQRNYKIPSPGNNTIPSDDPKNRTLQIVTVFKLSFPIHNTHQWSLVNCSNDSLLLLCIIRMNERKFKLQTHTHTHTHTHTQ